MVLTKTLVRKKGLKNDLKKLYKLVTLKNNSYVVSEPLPLKPAFSLYSEIIEIKHISKGDYIGYGINYQASKDMTIGIIAIGHGDGIDKTEGGSVLINNQKYQLLGIPCMDMIFVSIDENVNLYDKVTLIGDNIPVNEICNYLKTNYYAIFNKITKRAPRIYLKNSEVINMKGEDNEI